MAGIAIAYCCATHLLLLAQRRLSFYAANNLSGINMLLHGTVYFRIVVVAPFILMFAVILVTLGTKKKPPFFHLVSLKSTMACCGVSLKANPDVSRARFVNVASGALLLQPCSIKGIGCGLHVVNTGKLLYNKLVFQKTSGTVWSTTSYGCKITGVPLLGFLGKKGFHLMFSKYKFFIMRLSGYKLTLLVFFLSSNGISITLISESFYREYKLMVAIYFKHGMAVKTDVVVNVDVEKATYFFFFRFKQKINIYNKRMKRSGSQLLYLSSRIRQQCDIHPEIPTRSRSSYYSLFLNRRPSIIESLDLLLQAIDHSLQNFQEEATFGVVNITVNYHSY
ncbi:hypothetical protein EDC94DRAFT_587942 [Helicostylum pulchrum]|nr:hypothetical protein EDC94DRAFT_587942 [Helicostylum pulchrum]